MQPRPSLTLALALLLALTPLAAAEARSEVRTYEAAAMLANLSGLDDPLGVTSDGFVDAGGVAFATRFADTQATITLRDDVKAALDPMNAERVAAEVCQDFDGDSQCDISQVFCGSTSVALGAEPVGFQPGHDLVVFVYASEVNTPLLLFKPCPGPVQRAYAGTVTAQFA